MIDEGELPEGWAVKKLGDIAKFQNGNDFSKSQWEDEGRPIIRIQNLTGTGDSYNYYSGEVDDRYSVERGDILFAWSGTIDAFRWYGEDAWLNQHIYRVIPDKQVTEDYTYHLLKNAARRLEKKKVGSGLQHIRKSHVESLDVPVPPLDEQERIVEAVEERLERVERLEKSVNSIKQLSNEYEDSLLAFLFAGRDNLDSKPINTQPTKEDIPENWTIKKIGDVGRYLNGRTLPKKDINGGSYPVYGANGIIGYHDEKFVDEKCLAICQRGATTGVVNTVSPPAWVTGNSIICWPENIDYNYLKMYLSNYNFDKHTTKSRIKMLSQKNLKSVKIPVPPLEEQYKIVEEVEQIDFEEIEKSVDVLEQRFEEYRESVLAHAFKGHYT